MVGRSILFGRLIQQRDRGRPAEPQKKRIIQLGSIEIGLDGRTSNSERMATTGAVKLKAAGDSWKLNTYLEAHYAQKKANGKSVRTDNEINVGYEF